MTHLPRRTNAKLGKRQQTVLHFLRIHGQWFDGCGWIWGSHSETATVMESLQRKGVVDASEEIVGTNGYRHSVTIYRPVDR